MGSGGGTKTQYQQSPEQRQMYQMLLPLMQGLTGYGMQNMYGGTGGGMASPQVQSPTTQPSTMFGQPVSLAPGGFGGGPDRTAYSGGGADMGTPGSMGGTQQPFMAPAMNPPVSYGGGSFAPNLGAPSAPQMPSMQQMVGNPLMPTGDWFSSLDPSIKQGVWAPWNEAADMLSERMGGQGQLGSARGGMTGAAGAGLGELYSRAGQNVGLQAWNMMQPGLQAEYNQQSTDYANEVARRQADYQTSMQAWGLPFGMTNMMPNTFSQGITTQPSSGLAQAAPLLGGAGGFAAGGPLGGMLGMGLGSIFGGK